MDDAPSRSRHRLLKALAGVGIVLAAMAIIKTSPLSPGLGHSRLQTQQTTSSPTGGFMLGDYGAPIARAGEATSGPVIDTEATIRALVEAHVNTYAYLICPCGDVRPGASLAQWQQLPDFARRAGDAGIDIFVYLVPPTEVQEEAYEPFHWDYVAWFDQIGALASRERAVKGVIVDDFGGNVFPRPRLAFHFTVPYVHRMVAAAHRQAPNLTFMPIFYHHDLVGPNAVLSDYRNVIGGVVWPYQGYSDGHTFRGNTIDPRLALAQGVEISDLLSCPGGQQGCRQAVFPARAASDDTTDVAWWASVVAPVPHQRRLVSFSVTDDAGPLGRNSYRIQIMVGGVSVGTMHRAPGWNDRVFDITAATSTTASAQVELRVVRSGPIGTSRVTVQLSAISVQGMTSDGGFAKPAQTSPRVTSSPIANVPLIFMPYAKPLTAERGRGASPAYFASVFEQMAVLRRQGRIAGSMVFKLALSGSTLEPRSENYAIVARTYDDWSPP